MPTNVPAPSFGATGFVVPLQPAILAGVQADINTAFGGNLSFVNPSTPEGQIATSNTAIIGDAYAQLVALFNGMDPAYASGRQQDGIGNIYFMTRQGPTATIASCVCSGATGTVIPVGALASDQQGNIYSATAGGTIGASGSVTLQFACTVTGTIACPAGFVNLIYSSIPGWDSIVNPAPGVVGTATENRYAFETRRQQSVASNAQGTPPAVLGAIYAVPGVLDAYVTENVTNVTSGATIVGSISGTTLTITQVLGGAVAIVNGVLQAGQMLSGTGLSSPSISGTLGLGGTGAPLVGTTITALGSGTGGVGTYAVNLSQTFSGTMALGVGGIRLAPNSLYAAVVGGSIGAVVQAIWTKKSPGCNYNGNTTAAVLDTSPGYTSPYPSYLVTYETPPTAPFSVAIVMVQNPGVPSNAVSLVQAAILAAFAGQDTGPPPAGQRARIGSLVMASRFTPALQALGPWAQVTTIFLGIGAGSATQNFINVPINLEPALAAANISVVFV